MPLLSSWERKQAEPLNPNLLFAGQYTDDESGLAYNRFRYYDPQSGNYLASDPIGLNGGETPYAYVHNPMGWIDPFGLAGCHGHHSDPKFLGGDPKQPLTTLEDTIHRNLHKDMNDFLFGKTKVINGKTVHMRPQRRNSGAVIRRNFTRNERLDALAEFYKGIGSKYTEAVNDFFKLHPNLK